MDQCSSCGADFEPRKQRTGRPIKRCDKCRLRGREAQQRLRDGRGQAALDAQREYHHKRRAGALAAYGGQCDCCGVAHYEFLTFDHRDGGGVQHRKAIASRGNGFISWLYRNDFPDFIRLLCYNCNSSIGYLGYCPHDRAEVGG